MKSVSIFSTTIASEGLEGKLSSSSQKCVVDASETRIGRLCRTQSHYMLTIISSNQTKGCLHLGFWEYALRWKLEDEGCNASSSPLALLILSEKPISLLDKRCELSLS